MCDRLRERSLVDKLFVSFFSNANHPISERDSNVDEKIDEKLYADGNTQGKNTNVNSFSISRYQLYVSLIPSFLSLEMLQYININKKNLSCSLGLCRSDNWPERFKKVFRVSFKQMINSKKLLKTLFRTNKNIEKAVVDNLPKNNKVEIFERKEILNNPSRLEAFKCRSNTCQRSK